MPASIYPQNGVSGATKVCVMFGIQTLESPLATPKDTIRKIKMK